MENKPIPKPEGKAKLVLEDNGIKMYAIPKDAIGDLIKFGKGSEWCITGRHDTNGKIKVSQAIVNLKDIDPLNNLFYVIFTPSEKYCMHVEPDGRFYIRNHKDQSITESDLTKVSSKVADYFGIKDYSKIVYIYDGTSEVPNWVVNVRVKEGVTNIGNYAFYECENLQSITIPYSVTSIEYKAFYGCSSLQNIKIPKSITSIGDNAFEFCTNLQNIEIPDSVTHIGDWAFAYCENLQSVTIPGSITRIGWSVFCDCYNLKNINAPDNIKQMILDQIIR